MSFAVKKKNMFLYIAVVALLFVFRFVLAVCCLLFAVPTPAADMKVADEPQPLLTTAGGYWCVMPELIWCVSFCRGECMQIQMEFVDLVLRVHACLQSVPCLVGSLELACVCPV